MTKLLIIDDERNTLLGLNEFLKTRGYAVYTADSASEGIQIAKEEMPEIILSDVRLPDMNGLDLMTKLKVISPEAAIILFTAYGSVESAVEAMKKGANNYLIKPLNLDELESVLQQVRGTQALRKENKELRLRLDAYSEPTSLIEVSEKMKEVSSLIRQVAKSQSTILIEGESGCGKEIAAKMIHDCSERVGKPFVAIHCAALTDTLLLSELFGHEKGSFTGANERKIGRFEQASGGTLFLDEISEIPEAAQVKLLRVLQSREFERVGGIKTIHSDVRLVAATNRNLRQAVADGTFREDLFYRINVIQIVIPPLRDRKDDILPLARYFLNYFSKINNKRLSGMSPEAEQTLINYSWPGNVRELKNIVERMVVLAHGSSLSYDDIPMDLKTPSDSTKLFQYALSLGAGGIRGMEKEMIIKSIKDQFGNKSKAAKALGISRRTLYRKMLEYGIS